MAALAAAPPLVAQPPGVVDEAQGEASGLSVAGSKAAHVDVGVLGAVARESLTKPTVVPHVARTWLFEVEGDSAAAQRVDEPNGSPQELVPLLHLFFFVPRKPREAARTGGRAYRAARVVGHAEGLARWCQPRGLDLSTLHTVVEVFLDPPVQHVMTGPPLELPLLGISSEPPNRGSDAAAPGEDVRDVGLHAPITGGYPRFSNMTLRKLSAQSLKWSFCRDVNSLHVS